MLRIGSFARLGGTTPKTLRDYDALGLFRPAWVDPTTGYRAYSPAQLPELRRILALRLMGVGLAEIGGLVSGGADLRTVLERRRGELERERAEIDRRLAALDIHVETASAGAERLDVVVRPVAAEPVATLGVKVPGGGDVGRAFYELEAYVRDRGRRAPRPPGTLLHREDERGARTVEVFVPVRGPVAQTDRIGYRRLPAARMATIIHHGPYGSLPATRAALERWVGRRGDDPGRAASRHLPPVRRRAGARPPAGLPGGPRRRLRHGAPAPRRLSSRDLHRLVATRGGQGGRDRARSAPGNVPGDESATAG